MRVASQVAPGKPQILHCTEMSDVERERLHGTGRHTALGTLTVSQPVQVEFEFQIGELAVETGGQLLVVWRWPFDWSDLQTQQPDADGYLRIETELSGPVEQPPQLHARYNWIAGIEPWHHQLQVKLTAGRLRPGDRVRLICGDQSQGGAGWRAPTCVADRARFLMLIDHAGEGSRIRLVDQPAFAVRASAAVRATVIAPSDAVAGQPFEFIVRGEDEWGNPSPLTEPISVQAIPHGTVCAIKPIDRPAVRPVRTFEAIAPNPGSIQLQTIAGCGSAVSNTVEVHGSRPTQQLFWGDLHSGQTEIGCGCGSLAEHYAFGRDCAGLQFMTHQANDHYVTVDDWEHTRQVTQEFDEPHRFVAILGCEWSALTKDGGDRNVFYLEDEPQLRRSGRFFREDPPDPTPDAPTAPEFHEAFGHQNVLVNIHVGGRMTNLEWYDQRIEKLCETHSTHGTVEWFFMDVLQRGHRVGLTAGTDGVMGRPGACQPGRRLIRNLSNGLTAVYARELTRAAIWKALQNGHCYATSGPRIRLEFDVNGHPMGTAVSLDTPPSIRFRVVGTEPIERVELFRGIEVCHSWEVAPRSPQSDRLIRILWSGTERKGTARLQRAIWDGTLRVNAGELELLETVNFQAVDDQAQQPSPQMVSWNSSTAGNAAGLVLKLSAPNSAQIDLETGAVNPSWPLAHVLESEQTLSAGGLNRQIRVGPAPLKTGPTEFSAEFQDASPAAGTHPYWIRVTQIGQSLAWSTPVYVTYG